MALYLKSDFVFLFCILCIFVNIYSLQQEHVYFHEKDIIVKGIENDLQASSDWQASSKTKEKEEVIIRTDYWHGSPFPLKPIQLVKPDPDTHKHLILVQENLELLQRISEPVATIAVVGKFHSGKSFLMNQLMGKSSGFGIGPSVRPQTMGIWMWGKPMEMKLSSGLDIAVIFLDTEGFAANNVSENYDAKIFAVATLLSSYLIYNSVKIIDQADIDYLELLARRTQLFALRSQMSKAKWTDDFNHDLLSFPPLIWVVQDFVQSTSDETTTDWLHRLMTTHTRENDDYNISLLSVFKDVDCHTLFLPATKKKLLMDLSLAQEKDLTDDYRKERDELVLKLKNGLVPKEKNERPITGPELASLLNILVQAANDGSLAQIPSRWNVFIERLEATATEDCLKFYEAEMSAMLSKYNNEPVKPALLGEWHQNNSFHSQKLLQQLLFGLDTALEDAKQKLSNEIAQKFTWTVEINEKKVKLKLTETQHKIQLQLEEQLGEINLPQKTKELEQLINKLALQAGEKFEEIIGDLAGADVLDKQLKQLANAVKKMGDSLLLKNNKAMETVMETATEKALEKFNHRTGNKDNYPRTMSSLEELIFFATSESVKLFEMECEIVHEENLYQAFLSLLERKLRAEAAEVHKINADLVMKLTSQKAKELIERFTIQTDASHMSLPRNESDLTNKLALEMEREELAYAEVLEDYSMYSAYHDNLQHLRAEMLSLCSQRRRENVEAFTREVEAPLKTAKQVILVSADKYTTVFAVTRFMRTVCFLNLNDGKPKTWPQDLKDDIVTHYIKSDEQLQRIIQARIGFWSIFVGFFQWLLWLIGLA